MFISILELKTCKYTWLSVSTCGGLVRFFFSFLLGLVFLFVLLCVRIGVMMLGPCMQLIPREISPGGRWHEACGDAAALGAGGPAAQSLRGRTGHRAEALLPKLLHWGHPGHHGPHAVYHRRGEPSVGKAGFRRQALCGAIALGRAAGRDDAALGDTGHRAASRC